MQKKWQDQINQGVNEYYLITNRDDIDKLVEKIYQECKEYDIKNYFAYNKDI